MHAFDVLGDPVRRRILELLAATERSSGDVVSVISREFGITQPAVSQHLKVLRDNGFATVRPEGTRRIYAVDPNGPGAAEDWLAGLRGFWSQRLDALGTELARDRRQARTEESPRRTDPSDTGLRRTHE